MKDLIEFLPWDSRFFGLRIARLTSNHLNANTSRQALKQCEQKKIDCLYFLSRSDHPATLLQAGTSGFRLVDIRMSFRLDLDPPREPIRIGPNEHGVRFRLAHSKDERWLSRLAMTSYPHSRFATDPGFPKNQHQILFKEWVSRSIYGKFDDCVWIAEAGKKSAGFISCRRSTRDAGRIGLVGVEPRFRGHHIGASLIAQAFRWFQAERIQTVRVVTQGSNIAAQRLYQRSGFRTENVELWYHRWFQTKGF